MNINDIVEYYVGYIDEHEFWATDQTDTFEKAREKMNTRKAQDTNKVWMIFEKLTIFRKAIPENISVPY